MYILKCADDSYYTGSTIDLEKRLIEHQSGEGANHTKKRLPVELVYFEEFARKNEQLYMEIAAAAPPAPRAVVPKPAVTKPNLGPGKYDMSDDKDDDDDDDDRLRGD